jgi:hypothetical protein
MAVLLTPVIYLVHHFIERFLGKETSLKMKRAAMGGKEEEVFENIPTAG